jgi:hypothetical protein
MMTMRDELLLAYFDRLIEADKNGYICHREIAEVIAEIRKELGINGQESADVIDEEEMVDYIAELSNIDKAKIGVVLHWELEFLKSKGIAG